MRISAWTLAVVMVGASGTGFAAASAADQDPGFSYRRPSVENGASHIPAALGRLVAVVPEEYEDALWFEAEDGTIATVKVDRYGDPEIETVIRVYPRR